ncbi:hypothetical protein OEZ86_003881 [Tetradesmus obliquus]|nr:hypothetical protein OEZ86_003881 [Tetradesmus obliquus]
MSSSCPLPKPDVLKSISDFLDWEPTFVGYLDFNNLGEAIRRPSNVQPSTTKTGFTETENEDEADEEDGEDHDEEDNEDKQLPTFTPVNRAVDNKAKAIILHFISPEIRELVPRDKTAYDIWETLKSYWRGQNEGSRFDLQHDYHTIRMRPNESLQTYFSRGNRLYKLFKSAGGHVNETDHALILLAGLTPAYDTRKEIIKITYHNSKTLKAEDVLVTLLSKEGQMKRENEHKDDSALGSWHNKTNGYNGSSPSPSRDHARPNYGAAPSRNSCATFDHQQNHQQDYQDHRHTKSSNYTEPHDNSDNGSGRSPICKYCKKTGHAIEECRKKQRADDRRANPSAPKYSAAPNYSTLALSAISSTDAKPNCCSSAPSNAQPVSCLSRLVQRRRQCQLNKYNKALDEIKDSCFTAGQFDADLEPGNPDGTAADLFSGIHSAEAPGADLPSARHARYAATSQDVCFTFANNTKGYATAIGDCTVQIAHPTSGTRDIVLHDVYYVPEATANLLSIGKASKLPGMSFVFAGGNCNFFHNTDLIASTPEINNIYIFGHSAVPQAAAMLAKSAETPQLWHHRQAHLSYSSLAKQLHMVKGMHITTSQIQAASKAFCDVCPQAKGSKLPYHSHSSSAKATQPLARVHTDVMGPMEEISLGGKLWLATFIDEFTKYSIAVPMESKGDIKTVLPYTLAFMERQTNHKVKALRSDNGPEYMSNTVLAYLKKNGIRHEPTVTYNPQQNGMAERFNRTLMEKARAMLIEASLPKNLWAEAVNTANELYLLAPAAGLTCTPYEAFFKQKPDISHLRVFGSKVYSVTPPSKRKKLDPKATLGTLVGYAPKGYRILSNDTGDIVISRDVYFDECLPAPTIPTLQQNPTAKPTKSVSWSPTLATAEPGNTPPAASTDSPSPAGASGSHQPAGASGSHQPAGAGGSHQPAGAIDRSSSTSPARTTSPWPALDPPASPPSSNTSPPPPLSASPSGRARKPSTRYPASDYAQHADDDAIVEPKTIGEALSGPQAREWRHAIHRELQSLQQHATWVLMQLPAGHKALDVKWVFKIKRHADGKIERYKARLVVKGFQQREGIDYTEVYAPVSQHSTFRILLALAAQYGFALHHIDITTAFLNGELEEEVYVRQPPGFVEGPAGYVLQLKKALYGLKQAPRAWHTKLKAALHDMHLQPTSADPGLYVRNDSGGILLALVWVDDIIYGGTAHVEETKTQLLSTFDGRDLGEASYFLGMTVTRDPAAATIHLQQEQYTKELIAKYGMSDSKPRSTPLPTGIKLAAGEGEPLDTSVYHYGSVVGALNYLATCTRPDIAFASSLLCRYLSCPTKQHWQAAMSVLAYLNGTTSMGLVFNGKLGGLQPRGFCDASYGDDPDTRRSTSGSVFTAASGAVIWSSRLQKCVTLSTCESEYVAASHAARDAIWFDKVMFETGFGTSRVQMYGDNQGALKLIRNPITSMRSKHIDVHYHFVREQAASGRIKISFISTDKMLADMLTKAVPEAKHVFCCAGIGLR